MASVSPDDIEALITLFNDSDWDELHLTMDGFEIFLSSEAGAALPGLAAPGLAPGPGPEGAMQGGQQTTTPTPAAPLAPSPAAAPDAIPDGLIAIKAPNLGTFYRAPKPGAPPYVEEGQAVDAKTEVCLIEVMKLFTPVTAGLKGTIRKICVTDSELVEHDQVLFLIEPSE
ncbi:MAG: biotin/lipoyl-containing protein [Pseudomonadota bacterium]